MCRFLAYAGAPIFLDEVVTAPAHSLIHQSLHAEEAKTGTNGDGFGVGWYSERKEPGVYREIRPAWSDENLLSIARQVRSSLFFAHVRAATGTATTRANCHPFAHGPYLFMHNGQIGGYAKVKRRLEAMIPDHLYDARNGTCDSEVLFLLMIAKLEQGHDLRAALHDTLATALGAMQEAGVREPLRFAAAFADGETLHTIRWSSDTKPPTLYLCDRGDAVVVASEPVDARRDCWKPLAANTLVTIRPGTVNMNRFEVEGLIAA